ncbi:MAG TPA: DsrE family protein [Gammaproteobacteria bacterium]
MIKQVIKSRYVGATVIAALLIVFGAAWAQGNNGAQGNKGLNGNGMQVNNANYPYELPCPVDYYNGIPIDVEFGVGAEAITECLEVRDNAKVVVDVGVLHPSSPFGDVQAQRATFLSNIEHMVQNYEVVHGMKIGVDVDVVVIFSGSGAALATTEHRFFGGKGNTTPVANPFRHLIEYGLEKGFRFYLCQTASREIGINMSNKLPGINFVPGGKVAVADFEARGYALIVP